MSNLEELHAKLEIFNTAIAENFKSPEVLATLTKTFKSHNITFEDWNTVIDALTNNLEITPEINSILNNINDCLDEIYDELEGIYNKVDKTDSANIVYGTDGECNQVTYSVSDTLATAGSIVKRLLNGHIIAGSEGDTFEDYEAVPKKYADDNFIPAVEELNKLYGTDNVGNQSRQSYSDEANPSEIVKRTATGQIKVVLVPSDDDDATSKKYVQNLLGTLKRDTIQIVDSLPENGEEGIVYFLPIDSQDSSQGYYRYIWENDAWLDIGTTQIDLSDYYTKAQVNTLLLFKANDDEVVKLTGNQAINGSKLFGESPLVPNPTLATQATNKGYVDTELAKKVDKTTTNKKVYGTDISGNQTTFDIDYTVGADGNIVRRASGTSQIMVPLTPTANGHASSKKYVDDSIATAISSVYRYKGSRTVAQINALTGMVTGDVYNVSDSGTLRDGVVVVAGDNVAWNGSGWDKLAGDIDLSNYVEKSQTIAGLALSADITAQALTNALVYATDEDIDNLF